MQQYPNQKQPPDMEGYVTPEDLANRLGLHPSTLAKWRMARSGPPFVRVGKRILYSLDSLANWMQANEQQPRR